MTNDLLASMSGTGYCDCNPGYNRSSDGYECKPLKDAPCNLVPNCHEKATCNFDAKVRMYKCQCRPGYKGEGRDNCEKSVVPCNIINNCDVRFVQSYFYEGKTYQLFLLELPVNTVSKTEVSDASAWMGTREMDPGVNPFDPVMRIQGNVIQMLSVSHRRVWEHMPVTVGKGNEIYIRLFQFICHSIWLETEQSSLILVRS